MAKTLGKLRQQTAKLRELDVPLDVSKGTKNFVKKHVYVVHPDANENDDDVFKAVNVKKAKRYPDHGYESGQDSAVYEGKMKDFATKMDDMEKMHDHPIWDESHPNHGSAKRTLKNAPDSPQKRRIVKELGRDLKSGGETQHHKSQYGINEIFGLSKKEKAKRAAKKMTSSGPWERADKAMKATTASRYWTKNESYEETEDRNHDHHYLHTHIFDALESIHKTIGAHVNLMDNMNDKHHERSLNTLHKLHDSLLDFSERVSAIHMQARKNLGMHNETPPKPNHVTDVGGRAMLSPSIAGQTGPGKYSEGFEHITELSESDQSLLVDTYNNLSEDNQEKFLALAETPEGVDKLLDFAITNKGSV